MWRNGSAVDASVLVRDGIELEGSDARGHGESVFEGIEVARGDGIVSTRRFPGDCSIRPVPETGLLLFLLKIIPTNNGIQEAAHEQVVQVANGGAVNVVVFIRALLIH